MNAYTWLFIGHDGPRVQGLMDMNSQHNDLWRIQKLMVQLTVITFTGCHDNCTINWVGSTWVPLIH